MKKLFLLSLGFLLLTVNVNAQRIYPLNNVITIEGVGIYPIGKLFAAEKNGVFTFSIVSSKQAPFKEYSTKFSNIKDINGDPLGTLDQTRDYLATILGSESTSILDSISVSIDSISISVDSISDAINGINTITRTPTILRETGSGTITAGKRKVDVMNVGAADGTLLGVTIKPGESIPLIAGDVNEVLDVISYDGTGTELLITIIE